jgi:hypothetical protein
MPICFYNSAPPLLGNPAPPDTIAGQETFGQARLCGGGASKTTRPLTRLGAPGEEGEDERRTHGNTVWLR